MPSELLVATFIMLGEVLVAIFIMLSELLVAMPVSMSSGVSTVVLPVTIAMGPSPAIVQTVTPILY